MTCPTFVRTQFLGAGIIRFSGHLGWGGQGGTGGRSELQVELVEDPHCAANSVCYDEDGWGSAGTCNTDAFNPPELGKPCEFHFNTFRFGGVLHDWYEQDSADGPKTYLATLIDPTEILDGAQLICKGYTGETFGMPNLYNIYGWLEENYGAACPNWSGTIGPPAGFNVLLRYTPATKYGGASDRNGLPWSEIYLALQNMTGGFPSRFGGQLKYRNHLYFLDLSEMPGIDPDIKFSKDYYSIYELITEVCELAQYDFYVELSDKDTIAIRTVSRAFGSYDGGALAVDTSTGSNINARLNAGVIGSSVGAAQEAVSKQRGLELRDADVNVFMTGDYRKDMWQVSLTGTCDYAATIWPYWGEDKNGITILGEGCATSDFKNEHEFIIDISDLNLPGLATWTIDTTQMRCALNSEAAWRFYVLSVDNSLQDSINLISDGLLTSADGFLKTVIGAGEVKALDLAAATQRQMELAENLDYYEPVRNLYNIVKSYASNFMGQQFMVRLPYLCKKIYDAEPYRYYCNWDTSDSDSAWVDRNDMSAGYVLGLHVDSVPITLFKDNNGLIQGFVKFESTTNPIDMKDVPGNSYIMINPYLVYVRCHVVKIIHNVNGDPTDSRAVIQLDGALTLMNDNDPVPDPILLLYAISQKADLGLNRTQLLNFAHRVTSDQAYYGCPNLPILPVAAAVPLKSTINCYGPWGAMIGDNSGMAFSNAGRTKYIRDTGFSPWEFGNLTNMNYAGDVTVATQLSDKYVMERGSVELADVPTVSLGEALYSATSPVSDLRVNFAADTSAVTTTYNMQLYTARFGRLGSHWVNAIKQAGQDSARYRRFYTDKALEAYQGWMSKAYKYWSTIYQFMMKRFRGSSTHDFLVGEHLFDPESPQFARTAVGMAELTQVAPALEAGTPGWLRKAGMEAGGMFRPFSTTDSYWMANFENAGTPVWDEEYLLKNTMFYTKEQVPPIFCEEHHMPITMETLSPFLKDGQSVNGGQMTYGSSVGHDIEYIVRDGVYPAHLNVREAGYSENHEYRGIALKGPLVIAGWGFDTNNKPVPNASPSYPDNAQMYFEDNWLKKPWKWKAGPVDLRWDDRRKVWTSPAPFKIVRLKLCGPLLPGWCAHATMHHEDLQTTKDGDFLPWQHCCGSLLGNAKVTVQSNSHRPVPQGFDITAFYDTYTERYHMLYHDDPLYIVQVLTDMYPGALGLGQIVYIMGYAADQCGVLLGRIVGLDNPLWQPLCAGDFAITYLRTIFETQFETWCDWTCPSDGMQWHCILQAQFRPLNIVTWVSMIECISGHEQPIICTLTGGDSPYCYCDYSIQCMPIRDDWVEYDICVKDRQIWVQAAYSQEKAWEYPCTPPEGFPGGQGKGGSDNSDGYGSIRDFDCFGEYAECKYTDGF